ncbi:MAG: hypothetical protein AAF901_00420 [Bacteroidota bacterium]
MKQESKDNKLTIGLDGLFPLKQERTPTREYDLFKEEITARNDIRILDQKLIEESVYYDVLSSFEQEGTKYVDIWGRYSLLFPIIIFALIVSLFVLYKVFNFIKEYE